MFIVKDNGKCVGWAIIKERKSAERQILSLNLWCIYDVNTEDKELVQNYIKEPRNSLSLKIKKLKFT